ncbi:hypothetical protein D3C84_1028950 [compost metagenome]
MPNLDVIGRLEFDLMPKRRADQLVVDRYADWLHVRPLVLSRLLLNPPLNRHPLPGGESGQRGRVGQLIREKLYHR